MQCKNQKNCEFKTICAWILEQRQLPTDIWKLILKNFQNNDQLWRYKGEDNQMDLFCQYCLMRQGFCLTIYCVKHHSNQSEDRFPFVLIHNGSTAFFGADLNRVEENCMLHKFGEFVNIVRHADVQDKLFPFSHCALTIFIKNL